MPAAEMERRSGIALWRQIADSIRAEIAAGAFGDRLTPEHELAGRFGVNRHTVREAIASLVHEGVLRSEQGRGTFIEDVRRFAYPIGIRTRFSEGLDGQARELRGTLLGYAHVEASDAVAAALGLATGAPVLRMETRSEADGRPLSRATSYFDAARFPGFETVFAGNGSITAAFRAFGVADYVRRSTTISARHAVSADIADLRLSPGAIVLVSVAINEDLAGTAIQFSEARFAASRIEFSVSGR